MQISFSSTIYLLQANMKFIVLFALFTLAVASSLPFDPALDAHWENFKKTHEKQYIGSEESARRLIWEGHVKDIQNHNLEADMGLHSFMEGINEYCDMSHKEFVAKLNGFIMKNNLRSNGSSWLPPSNIQIPDRVDWREQGFVTPVKNQQQCGSCWAFSATGALEGQHKKKTGELVSLSEQNLIDCSWAQVNLGCRGGVQSYAFTYVQQNHGIDTEYSYPYTAKEGTCHFNQHTVGATCSGFVDIPKGDEEALKQAVATYGPISVSINAHLESFMNYRGGIYDEPSCSPEKLDHGVLVVGYGTEGGKDYWLVKNSWGESWGINGYIMMSRNKNNQCGIVSQASYPLV